MELKEMSAKIKDLLQIENMADLPQRLKMVVSSEKHEAFFDAYLHIAGGLETDYLQKAYQFWIADRGKGTKQQDYTPPSIATLAARLAKCPQGGTVYDCCAGSGALTIAKHKQDRSLKFVCEELDKNVLPVLLFNLAIRGIEAIVLRGDVLKNEIYEAYSVTPQGKYSRVKVLDSYQRGEYDAVVSNPPYNIPWEPPQAGGLLATDERFSKCDMPPKGNANFAFVLHCLHHAKTSGTVSMILPVGALQKDDGTRNIRQYLVDEKIIDAVVAMPDKMFESTGISTCLLTLKREGEGISLVDARQAYHEEVRNQRGEGDKSHTNRIYHKTLKAFTDEDIEKIVGAIEGKKNTPGFCKTATAEMLAEQNYQLAPSRYIDFEEREIPHRPYADIFRDIQIVNRERNAVKVTMNQTIAKQTGWDVIAAQVEEAAKKTGAMNNGIIKALGLEPLEKENWITLSKKAGEVKIENMSKESISSLFAIFMPMFKQHIFYLNNREDELLKELRDAILPDLMSGKIDVSDIEFAE